MDELTTADGRPIYVANDERLRGSKGSFLTVYRTNHRDNRYGFLCSVCNTVNNAMDTMGRIVCNECGNTKKPDEWDAAHE